MKKVVITIDIPDDAKPTLLTLDYVTKDDYGFVEIYKFKEIEEGFTKDD